MRCALTLLPHQALPVHGAELVRSHLPAALWPEVSALHSYVGDALLKIPRHHFAIGQSCLHRQQRFGSAGKSSFNGAVSQRIVMGHASASRTATISGEWRCNLMKKHLRWTMLVVMTVCIVPVAGAQSQAGSCWHETKSDFVAGMKGVPAGIKSIPGGLVHGDYKWLLPVGLATGLLIGTHADQRASAHITTASSIQTSRNVSNALIGAELGSAVLTYLLGCRGEGGQSHARSAGFHALEAAGYALATGGVLKAAFRREYPYTPGGDGRFWHSGKVFGSFPSGHSATSFALASALAHEYPHNKWIAIASYSAAVAVSDLRFSGKTHFPSDLLIGAAIGYPIGRYFAKP